MNQHEEFRQEVIMEYAEKNANWECGAKPCFLFRGTYGLADFVSLVGTVTRSIVGSPINKDHTRWSYDWRADPILCVQNSML